MWTEMSNPAILAKIGPIAIKYKVNKWCEK